MPTKATPVERGKASKSVIHSQERLVVVVGDGKGWVGGLTQDVMGGYSYC